MNALAENMFAAFANAGNNTEVRAEPVSVNAADYSINAAEERYGRFNRRRYRHKVDCSGMTGEQAIRTIREQTAIYLALQHEIEPLKAAINDAFSTLAMLRHQTHFTEPYEPDEGMYLDYFSFEYRHFIGFKRDDDTNTYVLTDGVHFFVYTPRTSMDFDKLPTADDIRKFSAQFKWFHTDLTQFMRFAIEEEIRLREEARLDAEAQYEKEQAELKRIYK